MLLHNESEARDYVAERCSPSAFSALETFATRICSESKKQNLVAQSTLDSLWLRHIADSAQLLDHVSRETGVWMDIGTGGGFPGLVIAIMRPHFEMVMIEPRRLRVEWLTAISDHLGLTNCRVVPLSIERTETLDAAVISARAFTNLPRLIELSARFSTNATEWVLPKGQSAAQDIDRLRNDLKPRFHVKQSITDSDAKIVIGRGCMETRA